jgi:hypothetical protein
MFWGESSPNAIEIADLFQFDIVKTVDGHPNVHKLAVNNHGQAMTRFLDLPLINGCRTVVCL